MNDINIQKLSMMLKNQIKKYFAYTSITLEAHKPYWKDPATYSVVYSILNNQNVKLADIIDLFSISWDYTESYTYNMEIQQRVNSEDAIWSKLCYPEEVFLMSEVEWVHLYTWETDKNG